MARLKKGGVHGHQLAEHVGLNVLDEVCEGIPVDKAAFPACVTVQIDVKEESFLF